MINATQALDAIPFDRIGRVSIEKDSVKINPNEKEGELVLTLADGTVLTYIVHVNTTNSKE